MAKILGKHPLARPYAMQCFLQKYRFAAPNGAAPWLTAFAGNKVAGNGAVFRQILRFREHLAQIAQIKGPPSYINIAQIGVWLAMILCLIEHFAKAHLAHIAEPHERPAGARRARNARLARNARISSSARSSRSARFASSSRRSRISSPARHCRPLWQSAPSAFQSRA